MIASTVNSTAYGYTVRSSNATGPGNQQQVAEPVQRRQVQVMRLARWRGPTLPSELDGSTTDRNQPHRGPAQLHAEAASIFAT